MKKLSPEQLGRNPIFAFKYSTSKGRDTYGYNIVTLRINGEKAAQCMGGGYDMQGTCLGDWIEAQFQEELKTLTPSHFEDGDGKGRRLGFYGLFMSKEKHGPVSKWESGATVHVDGGCGVSSMEAILKALGYWLRYLPSEGSRKDSGLYILERVKEAVAA
jgi:hypothetical protein